MKKTRELALLDAWEKIEYFTRENYKGIFDKGLRFRWYDGIYGWSDFGMTEEGKPYLVKGSHGTVSLNVYYNHSEHENRMAINGIEEVINNWESIKRRLEGAKKREENIYNFEI